MQTKQIYKEYIVIASYCLLSEYNIDIVFLDLPIFSEKGNLKF
jgi:hypothetical protein